MNKFDGYILKRSNRRSISIRILEDNSIVVSAPKTMAQREIDIFISEKQKWIERHISINTAKANRLKSVLAYESVLVEGEEVPLIIGETDWFSTNTVCVKNIKHLKKLYVDNLGGKFLNIYDNICAGTGLSGAKVGFRDYKSRWGCCSKLKEIIFNYKLLMLPVSMWEYVILHELCHTVYMNHSPKFYALMETFMLDCSARRKQIKEYSPISRLY